jgi:hypothetical protein
MSAKDRSNQNRDLSLARKDARVPQSQGLWGLRPEPATRLEYVADIPLSPAQPESALPKATK